MHLLHIAAPSFTDQHWQAYYSLMETLLDKYQTAMARVGWEQTRERFLSLMRSDKEYYRFVIFDNQTAVCWADLKIMAPGTPGQNVFVRVESAYENAPEEFERILAAEYLRLLRKHDSTSAHIMAPTERMSAIARHWNGTELNRFDQFRLSRAKANTSLMKSWLENIPRDNPDLRLEFFSPMPEEHMVVHTESFVRYIKEMPTERESEGQFQMTVEEARKDIEWRRNNNMHLYTYALFNVDDIMIGHSNAVINGSDPSYVYQAMTGIDSEYRGRGLSRWLKAALFFRVGEDFPANHTMTTDMRAVNAPIQKVNAEMGYVLLSAGHEFELSAEGLSKFLAG